MIFDAVQRAYLVAFTASKFATDLAALIAAKSPGIGLVSTVNFYKRQRAETFLALGAALPALGVWGNQVATQAKVGTGWRDNITEVVYDYYCLFASGATAAEKAAKQAELAAEALLMCVDSLPGSGDSVFGAGELRGSVRIEMSDGYLKEPAGWFRRAKVIFPLTDRDEPV